MCGHSHARQCLESHAERYALLAAMLVALIGGWAPISRGPAAHWWAIGAFVTLTAEAWAIYLLLRELREPDLARRNKGAVALAIIIFIFGWLWIKDRIVVQYADVR